MFTILVVLSTSSLKAENMEMNLAEFAIYVSETNKVNVLIDDDLKQQNIIFIVNDSNSFMLDAFRKSLNLKGLDLIQTDKFYYVKKRDLYLEPVKYRPIKLNFVKFDDIQNFLKVYEDKIKYEFISTSKTLLIASKEDEFNSIEQMIKAIDVLPKQLKLKVTIIETNLDKLKELGSDQTKINLQNDGNFFLNLVSYPFTVNNQVANSQKDNFYTFLKFLNSNGTSEFISNPVLTLSDEKPTSFNVVNNIPFQMGTTTINDTTLRTSNSYEYKDIGLQITVTPHIYEDNEVYLDLELNVSNIVSNDNNMPVTSKKYIKQSFQIPVGRLLILTGINKKELTTDYSNVPVLSDIPALGWFFKYDKTTEHNNNLSVVFELINENDFTTSNFNVIVPNKIKD